MNKIYNIPITLSIILFMMISCLPGSENTGIKPNVIILLTDQWRAQDIGYMGNRQLFTPNIDKLERESVNIVNAVSGTPVCSPYRASLLTGQYPLTHGVFYNDKPLRNQAYTMGEIFSDAGYATAYIGKWHLNGRTENMTVNESRVLPVPKERRQGFEFWRVHECTHDYRNSYYYDEQNEKHFWNGYDAFAQADLATDYISDHSSKDKPFLLLLSVGPPHAPYQTAPDKFRKMYEKIEQLSLRENVPAQFDSIARVRLAGYYAHITALDEVVEVLQISIAENGIEDNTIFIFTSDHGDMLYSHGFQKKQQPFDESIRVPFLIKYPAALNPYSRKLELPLNSPDILPTLLGLCDIEIPETVEGFDYATDLTSHTNVIDNPALISCQVPFHQWNYGRGGREYRGLRSNRYTYVEDLNGPWLLFDNVNDPYQLNNLVGDASVRSLQIEYHDLLLQKLKQRNDNFQIGDYYMTKWGYTYDGMDSL
ncbi:MAG: sulfatase, partial [Cyclobacteriaceae bacterium]|nr:sulfatase [Cyclobacteriaceae bacterium]